MVHAIDRRAFLAAGGGLCALGIAGQAIGREGSPNAAGRNQESQREYGTYFPAQHPDLVRSIVGASHGNIDRVKELLAVQPDIAKAAWDWGFGDWETALGAAAHTGRREIAMMLLKNGARMDIFAAAMLGHVDVVRAFIESQPGIERTLGPHGITLMNHAEAGGDEAKSVVEYLRGVPGADEGPRAVEISDEELAALCGTYVYGAGENERFTAEIDKGVFWFTPAGAPRRGLTHMGNLAFQPAGTHAVRVTFARNGSKCNASVTTPQKLIDARRE